MDIQPLPQMLDDLLHEAGDGGVEVCLSQAAPLSPAERGPVFEEYAVRYARVVRAISKDRGAPCFAGSPGDGAYPDWHRAPRLSMWQSGVGLVYVALCDDGTTLQLVAGARPHPIERDTITLLPPG